MHEGAGETAGLSEDAPLSRASRSQRAYPRRRVIARFSAFQRAFGIKRLAVPVVPGFLVRGVLPDVTGDHLPFFLSLSLSLSVPICYARFL